jgi:hypothetical protein
MQAAIVPDSDPRPFNAGDSEIPKDAPKSPTNTTRNANQPDIQLASRGVDRIHRNTIEPADVKGRSVYSRIGAS